MINCLNTMTLFMTVSCTVILCGCKDASQTIIVPEDGYAWPSQERHYWPTDGWEFAHMGDHDIDPGKMHLADQFAENDQLVRALLVVKDGYMVFEKYYRGGETNQSTNLHSVTKSFSSALIGFLVDDGIINSTDQHMAVLLPNYPEFHEITLQHTRTHTTGLSWTEEGILWLS